MGGGQKVQQTNSGQATAANAGATGAATNASKLSDLYSSQQQQLFKTLYGGPGGGAIGSMLDPSKLNVTSPTGVYGLQNTNANTAAAKQYALNAGKINSNAAQAGFGPGTPAGFVESQRNQNANALADTKGSNFSTATTNQYQDALKNFWNAANLTSGGAATAGQGALAGNSTAGNVYGNLYGTAGHGNVVQSSNWLSPILGAAGTVGGAAVGPGGIATSACCAEGTLIRTGPKEFTAIEKLFEGATVYGLPEEDDDPLLIRRPLAFAMKPCVRIKTDEGQELICSTDHTLLVPGGGYVTASDSLHSSVRTRAASVEVVEVQEVGERRVVRLHLEAPHVFESNGLLSEE